MHFPSLLTPGCLLLALATTTLSAKPIPENLGYGLDKLVESELAIAKASRQGAKALTEATQFEGYATQQAADYAANALTDAATGRFKVDAVLSGEVEIDKVLRALVRRVPSWTLTASDATYRGTGIVEGWVATADATAIAKIAGVRSVFLVLRPDVEAVVLPDTTVYSAARQFATLRALSTKRPAAQPQVVPGQVLNKLGTAFDQGVVQHRVDQINTYYNSSATSNFDGNGISIGAMSDSFNTRTAAPHAADAVATFDLPGAPTNPVNTTPVLVLKDQSTAGTDEGRAMLEIIYKMAPRARLAYATGVDGEVAFGNYIRAMAGIPGYQNTFSGGTMGFKADVIVDDISYGGEPFYGESIIGNAVDDAAAFGVSYFSSAGNNIGINAYESSLRIVPNGTGATAAAGNTALANTNINLTGVPAALYAGGFHNFNPAGTDVAALWNLPNNFMGSTEMQWDDPYDVRTPTVNQPPVFTGTGTTSGTFNGSSTPPLPPFAAGQGYVIQETATSGNFDGIVTLVAPDGSTVFSQDTGADETVNFFAPVTGQYSIVITPYSTTTGNFTLTVNSTSATSIITTDLNLLVFRADTGAYIASVSLTSNNLANNRPVELGMITSPTAQTQVQFVIARANMPTAPQLPTRVRISTRGNGAVGVGPAEYFSYNAVTTKGHATAAGGNGVAAYSPFRPNVPESFTSPGPATILFDKNAQRLATPIIRLQPTVAATDAANNSFFASDSTSDIDTNPNFSGTSAAAPHAAAIAGLVLQAHGGPGSVTPTQMRSVLQRSAFPHDLDPSYASGTAKTTDGGKVTVTIGSDNDTNTATGQNDPNSFTVSYVGTGALAGLAFNSNGLRTEAGAVTAGNSGIQDNTPATSVTYFENSYPGMVFLPGTKAFTLGALTGLTAADITQPVAGSGNGFTNPIPAQGTTITTYFTMTIGFPTGRFTGGKAVRFTVGRGVQHSANVSTGGVGTDGGTTTIVPLADIFGGGVFIPDGTVVQPGMRFSGTTTAGGTFFGTVQNRIGAGYSPVDGYGMINAQSAVTLPLQ